MNRRTIGSWLFIPTVALLLAAATACGSGEPAAGTATEAPSAIAGQSVETEDGFYVNVTPAELGAMLDAKDFPLVNVHIPYPGEIEGTDLFISYDRIQERIDELPGARDSKIVLYCRSGGMSAVAAEALVDLGYTNVWNLDGGMIAWEEAGYPLLKAQE
ncbi:MAG: rhodanese-like domain-containing protein [Dehalococcoidia bacterium]